MSINFVFNKSNADYYFKELAKELKKIHCKNKIEIVLVGGACVVLGYEFRDSSFDIDAFYSSDILKQAINNLGDRLNLPRGWLNNDFVRTSSFSTKLIEYSSFYKEFLHVLSVRLVKDEYLIAMKLCSFRKYKRDISDIVGIVESNNKITMSDIKNAINNLYGSYDAINQEAKSFIESLYLKTEHKINRNEIIISEDNERETLIKKGARDNRK